jgi:hypothetical protein
MSKYKHESVSVACDHCGKVREIIKDSLRKIRNGTQNNLCRSCSKRIQGGLSVAAKDFTEYVCPQCGKSRTITGGNLTKIISGEITGRCRSCAYTGIPKPGHPPSEKQLATYRQPRPFQIGDKNHEWKGGISSWRVSLRGTVQYSQWRRQVFSRDGFSCTLCGCSGTKLIVHHIRPLAMLLQENNIYCIEDAIKNESLWNINNGMTVCVACHKDIHKGRVKICQ